MRGAAGGHRSAVGVAVEVRHVDRDPEGALAERGRQLGPQAPGFLVRIGARPLRIAQRAICLAQPILEAGEVTGGSAFLGEGGLQFRDALAQRGAGGLRAGHLRDRLAVAGNK